MRRIAIHNQKAGSGKTTLAVNLAAALGETGSRVLLVDMDPQAAATGWLGVTDPRRGITDLFIDEKPLLDVVKATPVPGVTLIPGSAWLQGAEGALTWELDALQIFRRGVDGLPSDQWDYLIVDCPPALGILTANGLMGVWELLIPVEARAPVLPGAERVIDAAETLRTHLHPKLKVLGIVACRVDPKDRQSRDAVRKLRGRFGKLVFKEEVRENGGLTEAPASGMPITQYRADSQGAKDYRALATAVSEKGRQAGATSSKT
ncbi:MAG: ParA family protein [Candidatus Neomarinimicrobiota bacterium]